MTEKQRKEKQDEIENLKLILRFHSENRVLKKDKQFIEHIDEILDEISRLQKELENK